MMPPGSHTMTICRGKMIISLSQDMTTREIEGEVLQCTAVHKDIHMTRARHIIENTSTVRMVL